jgi:hypothetical protein
MTKNKASDVWGCDVHWSNSSPSVANFLTWSQIGRGEAWVFLAFYTGRGSISELFSSFLLVSWSCSLLWASPENSWCLTNLFGIQQGESASLGKIQRKPLPHINTGWGPSIDLPMDLSTWPEDESVQKGPKVFLLLIIPVYLH